MFLERYNLFASSCFVRGPVAQWIRRLTTDQEIPGSSPGRIVQILFHTREFILISFNNLSLLYL